MLPELPPDIEFSSMKKFPYPEGQQIEYKRSASEACLGSGLDKLKSTLCAFLNGFGGHFVCGVDDVSRQLIWMSMDSKKLDRLLLQIDEIVHRMMITTTDNKPIHPLNVVTRVIKRPSADPEIFEFIMIISAIPTPSTKYKYRGNMWYRLNASNYSATEEICYGAAEVRYMMVQQRKKIYADMAPIIADRGKQILELERRIIVLESELDERPMRSSTKEKEKEKEIDKSSILMKLLSVFCVC